MKKAFTLIELLITISLIIVLASVILGPVSKAFLHCKKWIYGAYTFKNSQVEAFLKDDATEKTMLYWTTNKPKPWVFFKINSDGTYQVDGNGMPIELK